MLLHATRILVRFCIWCGMNGSDIMESACDDLCKALLCCRANAQQPKLFVGMILILIFAEALALYGLIGATLFPTHGAGVWVCCAQSVYVPRHAT